MLRSGQRMQHAVQNPPSHAAPVAAGRALLESIREDKSLPALGGAVSQVLRMASSSDEAVGELARFILSDVALTQKILRLANTVMYRGASATPVTTVSRAIFLLGFDMIVSSATAMLLVERLSDRSHATAVRQELAGALYASAVARGLARRAYFKDVEEAAVAALFTNIGRVLVASHDHVAYREIIALQELEGLSDAQACTQCLGCSFDGLAAMVLREWQLPESTIIAALASAPGKARPVRTRQDWLNQAVAFSAEVSRLARNAPRQPDQQQQVERRQQCITELTDRFGDTLHIDAEQLSELMEQADRETRALLHQMEPPGCSDMTPEPGGTSAALADMLLANDGPGLLSVANRFASGKPTNARDLLLASVQDITQMMASGKAKASDLMLIILETLCHSMGFRFAAACLLDAQAGVYRARLAIGEDHVGKRSSMVFPVSPDQDLFHLALENDVDLLIADASEAKIRKLLPLWHRHAFPDTKSFIVLPLVVNRRKIGLFYADRILPAPEGVPPDETALIKTLKGQVLMALQAR